jgi:hypothetical protein
MGWVVRTATQALLETASFIAQVILVQATTTYAPDVQVMEPPVIQGQAQ